MISFALIVIFEPADLKGIDQFHFVSALVLEVLLRLVLVDVIRIVVASDPEFVVTE